MLSSFRGDRKIFCFSEKVRKWGFHLPLRREKWEDRTLPSVGEHHPFYWTAENTHPSHWWMWLCVSFSPHSRLRDQQHSLYLGRKPDLTWDKAEVCTHTSKRSEALLMFVKEYLLRGKCLFHLSCFHLLDEKTRPRGLRILRWTQYTKANTEGWTHFFVIFSFLFFKCWIPNPEPHTS